MFEKIIHHTTRQFVPVELNPGDWPSLKPLFDQLEGQLSNATDATQLEQAILNWEEISAAIAEESSKRYIAMTCQTDDQPAEQAHLDFIETIEPEVKKRSFHLAKALSSHPHRDGLPAKRYEVFTRDAALEVELFRPDNVPLETETAKLGQQYQKLIGGLTVTFDGKERTLVQMGRYLEETDRARRQEAWELVANRRLEEAENIDAQLDDLAKRRNQMSANASFPNYRDYAHRHKGRFDYTPDDCLAFHDAIEQEMVPLLTELHDERRAALGIESVRPWDTATDPHGRPPLKPFNEVSQLISRTQAIFDQLDGDLADWFRTMQKLDLLDLANRKGKAPGGYQDSLAEARLPFIFMNSIGVQRDVETLLHEAGHAFHTMASQEEPLHSYRHAPIEFCEVASMTMELLGGEYLGEFYDKEEVRRARITHLEGIVFVFPWIATVDAFQHWLYLNPGHSVTKRDAAWDSLMERFGGSVDWSGHESARAKLWHRQLHIFLHPFYYVEYGIAQLGALQVWANSKQDRARALADYKAALALGGSRPLPELFERCNTRLDFSRETVAPIARLLREELAALKNGA
ncbi:MAG: M3 family oligoendopeptidase [Verrucomicrobiota bacterium]|jgi:oligoendopeptidase F|nr:M3 family oligoendopeptidase [Verrucomicrobiota bacterium]MDP7049869.1 M3 family oligoendopeptidase [Verrucomicrobiota bacterium]